MNKHIQQSRDFSMFSKRAWSDWCTMAYTKGELFQRLQQVLKGSMDSRMKENILVCPLPFMSKGESDLVLLPSSPKGDIVGNMMHVLYLMATLS